VRNGTMPERSATRLLVTVQEQGEGKVLLSLPDAEFSEITISSRQNRTVLLFEDITERVKAEERISFMAHYDALTGLPNRAHFTQQVEQSLKNRSRGKVRDTEMLMIIDIDDFKHVNDTMGHQIGDRLLIETAQRLRKALNSNAVIARLGGDEFVVYRSGISSDQEAMADAEAVLSAFKAPMNLLGHDVSPTVSIGLVAARNSDEQLDSLMTKADLALYKCKANGKAQSQIFHEEMDFAYRYRQRLKAELQACVAAGGLTLAYQPIIDLKSRRVVGCEALARWHHPELGTIPPSVFVPIAEEIGLISDITRFVLNAATIECRNWPSDVRVAVNVSARDFRAGDITVMIDDALANSGLAAHRLEVEVTETAVIEEREAATNILSMLAARGIGIALDDFGTGYSSLSYLQSLPLTKLKIDRSFVVDIVTNPRSMKLLCNVAQLGKDIDLTVTVEGVETEEQLALIAEKTKVDQIQGYLFGVPLSRRDVGELIARLAAGARFEAETANRVNAH
jgi:diguanylate cyclase (GGDEF)-like protein